MTNTDVHPQTILTYRRPEGSRDGLWTRVPKSSRIEDFAGWPGDSKGCLEAERANGLLGEWDAQELVHPVHAC